MTMPALEVFTGRMPDMSQRWSPVQRMAPNNLQALAEGIMQVARAQQLFNCEQVQRFVIDRYSKPMIADSVEAVYVNAIAQRGR